MLLMGESSTAAVYILRYILKWKVGKLTKISRKKEEKWLRI